jgi:hypothetical protein
MLIFSVADEHEEGGKTHLLITKKSRFLLKEHETIPDAEEFAKDDKSVVSKQFENDFSSHHSTNVETIGNIIECLTMKNKFLYAKSYYYISVKQKYKRYS